MCLKDLIFLSAYTAASQMDSNELSQTVSKMIIQDQRW